MLENIFANQTPWGQIPTLMMNREERKLKWVDTLAVTMIAIYLAQLHQDWQTLWGDSIDRALGFIKQRVYRHEIERFPVWHFNAFYAPDWEDTSLAIYLLVKNNKLYISQLGSLGDILLHNTTDKGTGVWIKDPYSKNNGQNNHWDPTTSLNLLRLHYLLHTPKAKRLKVENFINQNLNLKQFNKTTLYYTPPVAAFFTKRLIEDFPDQTEIIRDNIISFYKQIRKLISQEILSASNFERALLGLPSAEQDNGFIFHHGRRFNIWYGSPVLLQLARFNNF